MRLATSGATLVLRQSLTEFFVSLRFENSENAGHEVLDLKGLGAPGIDAY